MDDLYRNTFLLFIYLLSHVEFSNIYVVVGLLTDDLSEREKKMFLSSEIFFNQSNITYSKKLFKKRKKKFYLYFFLNNFINYLSSDI
jgi:hypothetical protein